MRLPIRRWGAAIVGLVLALACHSARLSAGVVAPADSDPLPTTEKPPTSPPFAGGVATALPLPAANDPQAFWFPGADGDVNVEHLSVSSVPVRSHDLNAALAGVQQHPLIPLPSAAWTGLAGLLGLGAVKALRNFRRLLS